MENSNNKIEHPIHIDSNKIGDEETRNRLYKVDDKHFLETTKSNNIYELPPITKPLSSTEAIYIHAAYLNKNQEEFFSKTDLKAELSKHFSDNEINNHFGKEEDIQNKNGSYSNEQIDRAVSINFDKEDVQQIIELQKLKEEGKEITLEQKKQILENPNLTDERKLVLLTFLNDPSPEASIKENYLKLSSESNDKTTREQGRDLHNGMEKSKDSSLKKNAKSLANGIEKASRFTVD
jgi:hypothetical protein